MANGDKKLTKCNFCQYYVGLACLAKRDSYYCESALNEYYAWLKEQRSKIK